MRTSKQSNIRLYDLLRSVSQKDEEWEGLKALFDRHGVRASKSGTAVDKLVEQIRRDGSHTLANPVRRAEEIYKHGSPSVWNIGREVDKIWRKGLSSPGDALNRASNILTSMVIVAGDILQGEPVNYDEIVLDVAKTMKISVDPKVLQNQEEVELLIVQHVFKEVFDKLSPEERQNMEKAFADVGEKFDDFNKYFLQAGSGALVNALALINGRVLWQGVSTILRIVMARYVAGAMAYRAIGAFWAAVPILNALFGAWLVFDFLGPSYRKTIPTVVQVALMRLQFQYGDS